MQQKTQFIATVVHEPKLLILDEPFSGFDPINANMLKDEILGLKERGTTILFSTHRMESVEELCDSIALINRSQVVLTGEKDEVRNRFKKFEYEISFSGQLADSKAFEVISIVPEKNRAIIKLTQPDQTNLAIAALLKQVDLFEFKEMIPSFNDIFIQVVEETK
jgi:ABC-2 type transport system ATP-binding protein